MKAAVRSKLLRAQAIPLWAGLVPIALLVTFALRARTGLHPYTLVLGLLVLFGFVLSVAYHRWCARRWPRVVVTPMGFGSTLGVYGFLWFFSSLQMWGLQSGYAWTLSPDGMVSLARWMKVAARWLLGARLEADLPPWPMPAPEVWTGFYWNGMLWGALGYAFLFGLAGLGASLFRREAFDPRQTPFGGSGSWPMVRCLMGLYYGFTLGFYVGVLLIAAVGRFQSLPGLDALSRALGAIPDPNLAFATGLGASGWWLAAFALVTGRPDFTVRFTDPPVPEREPDMKVEIPPLPKTPAPDLDMSSLKYETDQMVLQFQKQLAQLSHELGFQDDLGSASSLVIGPSSSADDATDPAPSSLPVTNVISARRPDFDVAFDSAMGQLSNVYVQVSAQLGSTELPLTDWMTLTEGAVLEVPRSPDNLVTLCINGRPVGRARAVVLEDHKAIQVLSLSPDATQQLGR